MDIGDIVRSTQDWRDDSEHYIASNPETLEDGIFVASTGRTHSTMLVVFANCTEGTEDAEIGWSPEYLELVHELHTAEARAIHEQYPAYQGRDYFWYCEQRGVEPYRTPEELELIGMQPSGVAFETDELTLEEQGVFQLGAPSASQEPLPWQQWQPGDVLERLATIDGALSVVEDGAHLSLRNPVEAGWLYCNTLDGTAIEHELHAENFRFVRRPVAAAAATPEAPAPVDYSEPDNWRAGDILERTGSTTSSGGRQIVRGQQYVFSRCRTRHTNALLMDEDGLEVNFGYDPFSFRWVSRPGVTAVAAPVATPAPVAAPASYREWLPGDILRRTSPYGGASQILINQEATFLSTPENSLVEFEYAPGRRDRLSEHRFTWVRRPEQAAAPAAPRALQVGDRVRVVASADGHLEGTTYIGLQGVLQDTPGEGGGSVRLQKSDGSVVRFYPKNLELITAAPAEDLSTVPASEWRVGDTVRRVAATSETAHGGIGGEYKVKEARVNSYGQILTDANPAHDWYIPVADLVLVRRAATPTPPPNGLPRNTDVGARVLIAATSKAGSITGSSGSNYRVYVDGESSYAVYTAAELLPLTQEPEPPKLPEAFTRCWLDCTGLSKEEVQYFVEQVLSTTNLNNRTVGDNGYGSAATGLKNGSEGRRGGLHYNGTDLHYYQGNDGSMPQGLLTRDWNQVLNRLRQRHGNVRQGRNPFAGTQIPPPKLHALAKLPHYFIVEQSATPTQSIEQRNQNLMAGGFRGFMGTYSLFRGNDVLSTELVGAAEAFQRKHNCVWLKSKEDVQLLSNLFRTHKQMLTTQAAQQRFAIDVAASGPHLIVAFKAFMASIGYRQENAAKGDSPYILLNGGNIYANQPATWQYSDVKNNRNTLLNLAEPSHPTPGHEGTLSTKSGWEKLGERLANRGVALPVLDAEDLDRSPIAGDKVCLVFNDVQEGYPETEADLRAHTCGQQYTVKSLIGGLCLLTETGLRLHPDRLQVLEQPLGLQNGDQVVMTQAYGEHLSEGQVLTLFNGTLVAADNTAYAVPTGMYTAVTNELLTANLLRRYGITLPCVVKVTSEEFPEHVGHEVVLSTAWPLNNQELAFWTEDTAEKDNWLERQHFQVVIADPIAESGLWDARWKVLKGATRETTVVQIGETMIPLAQLEEAICA